MSGFTECTSFSYNRRHLVALDDRGAASSQTLCSHAGNPVTAMSQEEHDKMGIDYSGRIPFRRIVDLPLCKKCARKAGLS